MLLYSYVVLNDRGVVSFVPVLEKKKSIKLILVVIDLWASPQSHWILKNIDKHGLKRIEVIASAKENYISLIYYASSECVNKEMDKGEPNDITFFRLSEILVKIPHRRLLRKVSICRMTGKV